MKQVLLKTIKILIVVLAIFLVGLLLIGISLIFDWPWWVGLFFFIGLCGVLLGIIFLKKLWTRYREERFVQQVIEQDDSRLAALDGRERERSKDLQDRWKEAMETLRHSHLRKFGNPLYVLPWYLVIGESGSGKTTAIQSARLASPFAESTRTAGISGTRDCDWWFFEQAIIIDTAGRYTIPVDEGRDKQEWAQFLSLLAKYRKKEPINGLVVTVGADRLFSAGREELVEDGKNIRRRIDQLMSVLGAKFPIYLLVTKCDLIQGMTQFCDYLPEKAHKQAMGFINRERSRDAIAFLERGLFTLGERLRELRLQVLNKKGPKSFGQDIAQGVDASLLLFPEEFERLKPKLTAFVNGAFQENPYQETPILRGIFCSSGRQEGTPYSHFLKALGLIDDGEVLPGTSRGIFLHDFFSRILPKDRGLFTPTQRALEWTRLTRNLGLAAWVAVVIAICGLLSFSFVKNLRTLGYVRESTRPIIFQGEILTDVNQIERFRQAILKLEVENRSWWIPRFGLHESEKVELELKSRYCKQFHDRFIRHFDGEMEDTLANFSGATTVRAFAQYVDHLVKRINLIKARLRGAGLDVLEGKSQPSFEPIIIGEGQNPIPELRKKFGELYLSLLLWRRDLGALNDEMNKLQGWLKHVLTAKSGNLQWLTFWVNGYAPSLELTSEDFWGENRSPLYEDAFLPQVTILPAFTAQGKQQIDTFLREIEAALPDPLILSGQKQRFRDWYQMGYFSAWHDFGAAFPRGADHVANGKNRQILARSMAKDGGPYFLLLDRMAKELEPFGEQADMPSWGELVFDFQAAKATTPNVEAPAEQGALDRVTSKGQRLFNKLERKVGGTESMKSLETRLATSSMLSEYRESLADIAPVSNSRKVAFQMAAATFSEEQATGKSPFWLAQKALDKFVASLGLVHSEDAIMINLVSGPLNYLWDFTCKEAACHLQTLWEEKVLIEVEGISDEENVRKLLLGGDGYALKFIEGDAAPFVGRDLRRGSYAKEVLDRKLPFNESFFSFLDEGILALRVESKPQGIKAGYAVTIKGLPTDVNKEARIRPHATRLEFQCASKPIRLVNFHYPVEKTFTWSPKSCGDVTFEIEVGNVILRKRYPGAYAFAEFLKDFRNGKRIFLPEEFTNEVSALKRFGITRITVNYQFQGHEPILALLEPKEPILVAPQKPGEIVQCWGY